MQGVALSLYACSRPFAIWPLWGHGFNAHMNTRMSAPVRTATTINVTSTAAIPPMRVAHPVGVAPGVRVVFKLFVMVSSPSNDL